MLTTIKYFLFGSIKTISIPSDVLLIIPLLITFCGIIYLFNQLINKEIDIQTVNNDNTELNRKKLEDQFQPSNTSMPAIRSKKETTSKLHLVPNSKLLGLVSLGFLAVGGTSFLALQAHQTSTKEIKTSQSEILSQSLSKKIRLLFNESKVKRIAYISQSLLTHNYFEPNFSLKIQKKQIKKNFIL
tara:strand:- start:68 stop:625 length:558 start_codon:yes stop_codon:yes gene_type:complete